MSESPHQPQTAVRPSATSRWPYLSELQIVLQEKPFKCAALSTSNVFGFIHIVFGVNGIIQKSARTFLEDWLPDAAEICDIPFYVL